MSRLQWGGKQIENYSGAEVSGDSSHCSKTSMYSNWKQHLGTNRPKHLMVLGLNSITAMQTWHLDVMDHASETESVLGFIPRFWKKMTVHRQDSWRAQVMPLLITYRPGCEVSFRRTSKQRRIKPDEPWYGQWEAVYHLHSNSQWPVHCKYLK